MEIALEIFGDVKNPKKRQQDSSLSEVVVGLLNKLEQEPEIDNINDIDTIHVGFDQTVREAVEEAAEWFDFEVERADQFLHDDDIEEFRRRARNSNWSLMSEEAEEFPTVDLVVSGRDASASGEAFGRDIRRFDARNIILSTSRFIDYDSPAFEFNEGSAEAPA